MEWKDPLFQIGDFQPFKASLAVSRLPPRHLVLAFVSLEIVKE